MPQPLRQSIGFTEAGLERLKSLTTSLDASQRDIICALIELPDDLIAARVLEYQERIADEKNDLKRVASELKKRAKKLTPEQLAKIKEIMSE